MELLKLWEIVWRRRWIITQAFLVITLTAVIGSYLLTPIYKTSAKVLIKTSDITSSLLSSIGLSDVSSLVTTGSETAIATNIALATIDPVLNEVISKLQLKDKEGDLISPSALQESNIILSTIFPKPYVEVSQDEDADLIEIIASSPDPTEATMIANTLAEVYVEKNLKRRRAEYKSARQFIENRIEIAKSDYLKVLEEIKRFNIREKTVDLEQEKKVAIEKMAELMKEKEDGITDIYETRARIETLKVQLAKQNEMVVSSAAVSDNPQIENLKKQITDIELQLVEELTEKTQDHPDVVALEAKIRKARGELGREIDIFQETSEDLIVLERELAAQEAHLKGVNADIQRYSSLLYTIPEKAFTQSQLELKLSASQEIYSSLLEYLYQIGVAEVMTLTDIRLVETATEPDIEKLASPNKTLNAIMGAFLGLMFGFGLAFLVDYLDDTIKDPAEAKEQELTLLGTIPKSGRKESPLISMRDPKDPLSESYRTIRNSLKFASLDKPIKSLLIISSLEGEGRTTTVINLAVSKAREGKKVLVMDTNLRNPEINKMFGMPNSHGITNILAEEARIEDVIMETGVEGLSLFTSGPLPPDPGRMVESTKMRELIKGLVQQYDMVILDSPPVLIVNDAVVLAEYVDASILILESRRITDRALTQARELLKQANVQPIGAILNKFGE